jgi:ArsR family transcriptional regulator
MKTLPLAVTTSCCPDCGCESHANSVDHAAATRASAVFHALADPIRVGIVTLLSGHDKLCVCEIVEAFRVGQPTVSHHLRVLREAGLVDVERRAQWAYYGLRRDALKAVAGQLVELL